MSKKVIGIDLGTGNSCCAVIENGKPVVVANDTGNRTTPSVVSLKDGDHKVGASANRQRIVNPKETIFNIKRFMGCDFGQCSEVISKVPYEVVNRDNRPRVSVDGREYSPEEVSSYILAKMKKTAEDYLGEEVKDAVITCPAWFDSAAREATKLAGEMCGLNVLRVINEPTAAILSSNIDLSNGDKVILVADIGQGTTDFSVCELSSDGVVEVKASNGDVFLGGADFDNAIVQWVAEEFKNAHGIDLLKDTQATQRILEAAERAKIELSNSTATEINLPYITINEERTPLHLSTTLTRAKLEQLTDKLVDRIIECGRKAINAAKVNYSDIDSILLVGGQSRSLAIQEALTKTFGRPLNKSVNPDEAVAMGAAIQANILVGGEGAKDLLLLDVTPLTLGIETEGNVMTTIVEANTTVPCRRSQVFTTAMDNQPSVTLNILQGCRPKASDNKSLGVFNLDGIAPAPRGIPQIEVTIEISSDGILTVTAQDKATGKEQHITIENKNSLSQEEIDRIKREAELHAEEDERTRQEQEKLNKCETLLFQTEKMLEDETMKQHITDADRDFLKEKVESVRSLKKEHNIVKMEEGMHELEAKLHAIATAAYAQQQPQSNQQPNGQAPDFKDLFGSNNPFSHNA